MRTLENKEIALWKLWKIKKNRWISVPALTRVNLTKLVMMCGYPQLAVTLGNRWQHNLFTAVIQHLKAWRCNQWHCSHQFPFWWCFQLHLVKQSMVFQENIWWWTFPLNLPNNLRPDCNQMAMWPLPIGLPTLFTRDLVAQAVWWWRVHFPLPSATRAVQPNFTLTRATHVRFISFSVKCCAIIVSVFCSCNHFTEVQRQCLHCYARITKQIFSADQLLLRNWRWWRRLH